MCIHVTRQHKDCKYDLRRIECLVIKLNTIIHIYSEIFVNQLQLVRGTFGTLMIWWIMLIIFRMPPIVCHAICTFHFFEKGSASISYICSQIPLSIISNLLLLLRCQVNSKTLLLVVHSTPTQDLGTWWTICN